MCNEPDMIPVLDPFGRSAIDPSTLLSAPRARAFPRMRLVIIDNQITGMAQLAAAITANMSEALSAVCRHVRVAHFPAIDSYTDEALAEMLTDADMVVVGLGNCGSCTTWNCRLGGLLMRRVPTLQVVAVPFEGLAKAASRSAGYHDVPLAVLPESNVSDLSDAAGAAAAAAIVVATLHTGSGAR
jgi:hypothetical protein